MSLKDALGLVIRARPPVCPNSGFIQQLQELDVKLHGTLSLDVESLPSKKEDRLAFFACVYPFLLIRHVYIDIFRASLKNRNSNKSNRQKHVFITDG